jgi:hypothetical protein
MFESVIEMDLVRFIATHKELNEPPFLAVFKTMLELKKMGVLKFKEGDSDVEISQRKPDK